MRAAAWLVCLLPATAHAQSADPWWGRDKALHLSVSAALAGGGYGAATFITSSRPARFGLGLGGALAVGAAKELYDLGGRGDPSGKDLLWDGVGALVGALVGLGLDWALSSEPAPPGDSPVAPGGVGGRGAAGFASLRVCRDGLRSTPVPWMSHNWGGRPPNM
jgi:putative lipoprotein